ncbi:MAG: peptidoglycan recognition family protein [Cyanobacteria bacterium P01_A01_bin.135]
MREASTRGSAIARPAVWLALAAITLAIALPGVTQPSPHPHPAQVGVILPVTAGEFDWRYRRQSMTKQMAPQPPLLAQGYQPPEQIVPADPSNYGPRYETDIHGQPALYPLIVVIHETVGSADSAINTFQTYHARDQDQVSYHSLIRRDGTIVHLVHPQMRAFGAGNSVFVGAGGPETVQTNPAFPSSVNNFAYHTSLETPADGRGNQRSHSGYTEAQYRSLAWLIAQLPVPQERITTHRAVDRSGQKIDPRSFDGQQLLTQLALG